MTQDELTNVILDVVENGRPALFLNSAGISELPSEIKELVNLEELSLNGNQLTALPSEIKEMVHLHTLSAKGNRLSALPAGIGELANLSDLSLSDNKLTTVPAAFRKLQKLRYLSLSGNNLSALPVGVTRLANLQYLQLERNQLVSIPPEIEELVNLKILLLSENQLNILPVEIKELVNLEALSLSVNQLKILPVEIGKLSNLSHLHLDRNPLPALPAEIKELENLRNLYLDQDQLKNWASTIVRLKGIVLNIWNGTEYDPISSEVIDTFRTGRELTNYYFKIQTSENAGLNEAKIIIIGQGNVGKTSLCQRLLGKKYKNSGRTDGVSIDKWETKVFNERTDEPETVNLNIWDFGGQEIYHTTHQLFFRSRCLYILVIDLRLGVNESRAHYWLRQAQAFGKNAPVLVVLNKAEQDNEESIDRRYEKRKEEILALKSSFPNIWDCILVSCEKNLGIAEVEDKIRLAIRERMPEVFTVIPASWFAIKEKLEAINKDYLTDEEFDEICGQVPQEDRRQLVEILDALGIIVSFEEGELSVTKVIKPEWITQGIYKILASYKLDENNGNVTPADIREIFSEYKENYPAEKIDYILRLMEKYDLCFLESAGGGKRNLLFPVAFPIIEKNHQPLGKNTTHLEYRYQNEYYDSIIVRFLKSAYIVFGQEFNYWRKGLSGRIKGHQIYVRADDVSNRIEIIVDGDSGGRRDLLEQIIKIIDKIHEDFGGLEVEKILFHPTKTGIVFSYDTVIKRQENGKDLISYTDSEGKGMKTSLRYLLEGVAVEEILESEGETGKSGTSDQTDVERINAALIEQHPLVRKKSVLDTISWIFWIAILSSLLGLAIWRISRMGDYSDPVFLAAVSALLALFAVVPIVLGFLINLLSGGDEKVKKNLVTGAYRFPIRFLQTGLYAVARFDEKKFKEISLRLDSLKKSEQIPE